MSLTPGTRLGPYEVTAQIGVGGMGEVYQATDTKLKRQVAIKVLPDAVAADRDRLARFQREAEVLATLNHPNIAAIYGLEDAPGGTALVMELVEGPTLADRVARGAIPVDEALPIAKQIAEALEAAHEQGIIHRDLKPANIKVREDGTVKVLDFGLAKAMEPTGTANSVSASMSPTITSPAMTEMGMILGTAAYMSPEQARGKPVDHRADIWAFGCVLYEMLTGRRGFKGEDVSMTLSQILQREPDFDALPVTVPTRLRRVIELCLRKDVRQRPQAIGDVRLALDGAFETSVPAAHASASLRSWQRPGLAAGALLLALAGSAAGWILKPVPAAEPMPVARIATPFRAGQEPIGQMKFTADGAGLVYVGRGASLGTSQLWIRQWANLDASPLRDTEGAATFALSPDQREVAWASIGGPLRISGLAGSPGRTLVDQVGAVWAWTSDGTLWYTALGTNSLSRVPAMGGAIRSLTELREDEFVHFHMTVLPGGKMGVFDAKERLTSPEAMLWAVDLVSGDRHPLVQGQTPQYIPTGHLLFASAQGTLMMAPIDPEVAELTGPPVPVVEGLSVENAVGMAHYATSERGALIYLTGGSNPGRTLVHVDRKKVEAPLGLPPGAYNYPRLSPDGTRVALASLDPFDIFVWDRRTSRLTNVTASPEFETYPLWMPDGTRLVVSAGLSDNPDQRLYVRPADGSGTPVPLTEEAPGEGYAPNTVSPDGAFLVFRRGNPNQDLSLLSLDAEHRTQTLIATEANELNADVSPNGRWVAYQSNRSGAYEIYVSPFPDATSRRWQVSTGGGQWPVWSRDGEHLFYIGSGTQLMSVKVYADQGTFANDAAEALFDVSSYNLSVGARPGRSYEVDGDGFLFLKTAESQDANTTSREVLVLNWFEELKRLVPRE